MFALSHSIWHLASLLYHKKVILLLSGEYVWKIIIHKNTFIYAKMMFLYFEGTETIVLLTQVSIPEHPPRFPAYMHAYLAGPHAQDVNMSLSEGTPCLYDPGTGLDSGGGVAGGGGGYLWHGA